MEVKKKEDKNTYRIQSIYLENGQKMESAIENAFIKYLKFNEYIENK